MALSSEYQARYGLDIPEWRVLATLGRPEAGPWLAIWGLWAWVKVPSLATRV